MIVTGFSTMNNYAWTVGDTKYFSKALKTVIERDVGDVLAKFISLLYTNNNISVYGAIIYFWLR